MEATDFHLLRPIIPFHIKRPFFPPRLPSFPRFVRVYSNSKVTTLSPSTHSHTHTQIESRWESLPIITFSSIRIRQISVHLDAFVNLPTVCGSLNLALSYLKSWMEVIEGQFRRGNGWPIGCPTMTTPFEGCQSTLVASLYWPFSSIVLFPE